MTLDLFIPDTSEGEDDGEGGKWEDGWVKQEMEGLEERERGLICRWERELFWWGGGEALRRKRRREWEEEGWEAWEVIEETGE